MDKFMKKISNIDIKLSYYKTIINKYLKPFSLTITFTMVLFIEFWNTVLRFIPIMTLVFMLFLTISFIIDVINISRKKGYKFFKSINFNLKQMMLSIKLKLSFCYLKYNFLFKFGSFLYYIFKIIILALIPLLFIYIPLSAKFNDLLDKFPEQKVDNLFNISTMIFGIVIALFSILVSVKHSKIYNQNEYNLVLKYNIGPFSIKHIITYNVIYFVLVIIGYVLGYENALSIILLIIYGLMAIISLIVVINSSIVKIYYNVNNLFWENIFQKRKGNFVNFLQSGENIQEKVDDIMKLSASKAFLEFSIYLQKLNEKVFYSQTPIQEFDVELFNKYTIEYFKQINNDCKIFGLSNYIQRLRGLLELLHKKNEFHFFEKIVYLINDQLLKFLKSKEMHKRFKNVTVEECRFSMLYDELVLSIFFRNLIIIETIIPSINEYFDFIKNLIIKDETKYFKLSIGEYDKMKNQIFDVLKVYKSNTDLFNSTITCVIHDFEKQVEIILDKIKKNQ